MMKYAVIDIGSNSVRLMLWAGGALYKKVCTTRLAEGLTRQGVLLDGAMERTARAVAAFCEEGRNAGAQVVAFATAAVRDAANGGVFCARVRQLCGVEVDVVSGEEEALLGLNGALGDGDGGIVDIGGASTEICIRDLCRVQYSVSFPIGAVRIHETCGQSLGMIDAYVAQTVATLRPACRCERLVAIGGTASTLASMYLEYDGGYDAKKLNATRIPLQWVKSAVLRLAVTPPEERVNIPGMDPRRADIILGGAVLLMQIMERLRLREVTFSDADNLEGYLRQRGLK